MTADGLHRLPKETDDVLDGLRPPPRLTGCREALAGQGPATQDQPTTRRRALVCRVADQPQAAGVWKPVESLRSTSERDREQYKGQMRGRSSFAVSSCGVVEWEVSS